MRSKKCSREHFLFDLGMRNCFFEQYDDCHSKKESALVLEKGSRGVPWADGSGTGWISPRPGMVRKLSPEERNRGGARGSRSFWRSEVLAEGRHREPWQLEQWEDAIKWYLAWLDACAEDGADHRSLPERVPAAVNSAGARRGLARRTKQCYGAWAARFAVFAGGEREVMQVETATRFLTAVVAEEDCAYSVDTTRRSSGRRRRPASKRG